MPMDDPTLSAPMVLAVFSQVDHNCSYADADLIAQIVNRRAGDVQRAVEACEGKPVYGRILAYREALEEIENPAKLAARLSFEASCEKERADKAQARADSYRRTFDHTGDQQYAEMAAASERTAIGHLKAVKGKVAKADAIGLRFMRAEAV